MEYVDKSIDVATVRNLPRRDGHGPDVVFFQHANSPDYEWPPYQEIESTRDAFQEIIDLMKNAIYVPIIRIRVMREVKRSGRPIPVHVSTVELDSDLWEVVTDEDGVPLDTMHRSSREILAFQSKNFEGAHDELKALGSDGTGIA